MSTSIYATSPPSGKYKKISTKHGVITATGARRIINGMKSKTNKKKRNKKQENKKLLLN
jgi:ribosomal protein S21